MLMFVEYIVLKDVKPLAIVFMTLYITVRGKTWKRTHKKQIISIGRINNGILHGNEVIDDFFRDFNRKPKYLGLISLALAGQFCQTPPHHTK